METEKRRKESESDSESATNKKLKLESASIITNDPPKNEEKKEEKKEEKTEVKTEKEEKITTASIIITDTKTDEKTEEKSEDQKEPPKVDEQIIKGRNKSFLFNWIDLEIQILTKMRDYKENRIKDQVTYSDINLQELLNPSERLESIIFHSTKRFSSKLFILNFIRHAANNLHMESVADNAIRYFMLLKHRLMK